MRERLIAIVSEKTGIEPEKAEAAVNEVLGYLKENPQDLKELVGMEPGGPDLKERLSEAKEKIAPVAEKGKERLGEARERVAPLAAKGKERLGEAREKLTPKAKEASSTVSTRLKSLIKRDKNGAAPDGTEAAEATDTSEEASTSQAQ